MQEHVELQVARNAWSSAPRGVSENIGGRRIVKSAKMVLVMPRFWPVPSNLGVVHEVNILAYPKPQHIPIFAEASYSVVRHGGPAANAPGAIGTVEFRAHGSGFFELSYAQSHFKTGEEPPFIKRNLATYYGGWRKRALTEGIQIALARGFRVQIPGNFLYNGRRRSQLHREVIEIAKEIGARIRREDLGIVLRPKR